MTRYLGASIAAGHELLLVYEEESCSVGAEPAKMRCNDDVSPSIATFLVTNLGDKTKSSSRVTKVKENRRARSRAIPIGSLGSAKYRRQQ
jgi:hypothetical protein